MPFLLKSHSSYSDIAIFALSTYPYSLKLFWSPIVDSIFVQNFKIGGLNLSLGRRKSWIVPIQMMLGAMLWVLSGRIEDIMNQVSMGDERGEKRKGLKLTISHFVSRL